MSQGIQIGLLALLAGQAVAVPSAPSSPTFQTFADWCMHQAELSPAARHTVEVLLQQAETQTCDLAQETLSTRTQLFLANIGITDLTPLATLTNLTNLNLAGNQLTDVTPLAELTNLTEQICLSGEIN